MKKAQILTALLASKGGSGAAIRRAGPDTLARPDTVNAWVALMGLAPGSDAQGSGRRGHENARSVDVRSDRLGRNRVPGLH